VTLHEQGVLSFGGVDRGGGGEALASDAYRLDLEVGERGTWSEVRTSGEAPGDRADHAAAARRLGDASLMYSYGGIDEIAPTGGTFTWRSPLLGGGRPDHGSRLGRYAPHAVVDYGHVLTLDGPIAEWSRLSLDGGVPLADAAAVWSADLEQLVIFGGRSSEDPTSASADVHAIDPAAGTWRTFRPEVSPSPRFAHTAVYDHPRRRMLVFGGTRNWVNGLNDTWALDLTGGIEAAAWQRLETEGSAPGRRYDHAAVYDPVRDRMIVFGGTPNGSDALGDIHVLDLAVAPPAWRELDPEGASPPRLAETAGAWTDAAGGLAVFHAGQEAGYSRPDAWGLRCGPEGPATPTATATAGATAPATTATSNATAVGPSTATAPATPSAEASPTPTPTKWMSWRALLPIADTMR